MNKENIQKAIEYLEANYNDISKRFDMDDYRENSSCDLSPVCRSTGCLVGHLTAIDAEGFYKNSDSDQLTAFTHWSEHFFDIGEYDWYFMFDSDWSKFPETNTLQQGINRMKYMLEHGQPPKDWEYGDTYE